MTTNGALMPSTTEWDSGATVPGSMNAIVQARYGSADELAMARIPVPELGSGEVLVAVEAAGLDRGVWHLMSGEPYLIRLMGYGFAKPKNPVPGADLAGRVVAIGDEVEKFTVGDVVFGIGRGTYATYAVAEESKLAHMPANASNEAAAVSAILPLVPIFGSRGNSLPDEGAVKDAAGLRECRTSPPR